MLLTGCAPNQQSSYGNTEGISWDVWVGVKKKVSLAGGGVIFKLLNNQVTRADKVRPLGIYSLVIEQRQRTKTSKHTGFGYLFFVEESWPRLVRVTTHTTAVLLAGTNPHSMLLRTFKGTVNKFGNSLAHFWLIACERTGGWWCIDEERYSFVVFPRKQKLYIVIHPPPFLYKVLERLIRISLKYWSTH